MLNDKSIIAAIPFRFPHMHALSSPTNTHRHIHTKLVLWAQAVGRCASRKVLQWCHFEQFAGLEGSDELPAEQQTVVLLCTSVCVWGQVLPTDSAEQVGVCQHCGGCIDGDREGISQTRKWEALHSEAEAMTSFCLFSNKIYLLSFLFSFFTPSPSATVAGRRVLRALQLPPPLGCWGICICIFFVVLHPHLHSNIFSLLLWAVQT